MTDLELERKTGIKKGDKFIWKFQAEYYDAEIISEKKFPDGTNYKVLLTWPGTNGKTYIGKRTQTINDLLKHGYKG